MQKRGREKSSMRKSQYDQSFIRSRPSSIKSSATGATRSYVSSRVSFGSSRRNLASESTKQMIKPSWQILDESGVDVTPQPLLQLDVNVIKKTQSTHSDKDPSSVSSAMQQSLFGHSFSLPLTSSGAQGPFSSSVFGSISDIGTTGGSIIRSFTDEQRGNVGKQGKQSKENKDFLEDNKRHSVSLTESDLERPVWLTLSETDTIWLLDMDSSTVAKDSEEAATVQAQNEQYQQLLRSREGNDRYVQKGIQTLNFDQKIKGSQTTHVEKKSSGAWATVWDIYDTYEDDCDPEDHEDKPDESAVTSANISRKTSGTTVRGGGDRGTSLTGKSFATQTFHTTVQGEGQTVSPSMMVGNESSAVSTLERAMVSQGQEKSEEQTNLDPTQPNDHPIMKLPTLTEKLLILERAVLMNVYQEKQALYRGLPVLKDPYVESSSTERQFVIHKPHLERLWSFSSIQTKEKQASCIAWNKQNPDIIAAGYGNVSFSGQEEGLICCWSLKNPEHPERVYKASSAVTSLSFSDTHPNLLAAGLYDGNIALYNLRTTNPECMLDTRDNISSHFGPVWQVDWVEKERSTAEDRTEVLVSIGSDGRITQWSIRKGFEGTQLMRIKRPSPVEEQQQTKGRPKQGQGNQEAISGSLSAEALISQYTAGLAFDFWPGDVNIYLASIQEGLIHKCSCSYNEQFLETYEGHTGPVLKVKWSPFRSSHLFISCSVDWSVKIWHQDKPSPLLSLTSAQCHKAIVDVCWCPWNALMFATASTGRIEVWDLSVNILDPYIVHKVSGNVQQCCLKFGVNAKVLIVGDAKGTVSVYQMRNVPEIPLAEDPMSSLLAVISKEL